MLSKIILILVGFITLPSGVFSSFNVVAGIIFLITVSAVLLFILLRNKRIPFNDPEIHFELFTIHEVMVWNYSLVEPSLFRLTIGSGLGLFGVVLGNPIIARTNQKLCGPSYFFRSYQLAGQLNYSPQKERSCQPQKKSNRLSRTFPKMDGKV